MQVLRHRGTFIMVVLGGLLCIGLLILIIQQYGALGDAREELATEESALEVARANLQRRMELAERSDEMEESLAILHDHMPTEPGESQIINLIQEWADDVGIDFVTIRFGDRLDQEDYIQMPLQLSFDGRYPQMFELINRMTQSDRAFRIEQVHMGSAQGNPPELAVTIRCSVFYSVE